MDTGMETPKLIQIPSTASGVSSPRSLGGGCSRDHRKVYEAGDPLAAYFRGRVRRQAAEAEFLSGFRMGHPASPRTPPSSDSPL